MNSTLKLLEIMRNDKNQNNMIKAALEFAKKK